MIDLPDHDCFEDTGDRYDDCPDALAIIAGLFLCFCAVVAAGLARVWGWW
jgi:hypothetical protein